MRNKILNNLTRTILNIHITPIHPTMLTLQRRTQQIIPRPSQRLPPPRLRLEAMPILDLHRVEHAKILLHNHRAAERHVLVGVRLHALQLGRQQAHRVVQRVADQEGEVDEVVGVGQLGEQVEVLLEVGGGVAERGQDQDALLVRDGVGRGGDGVEIDFGDGLVGDFDGRVVVVDDGRLEVRVPRRVLVGCHFHGGFGGSPTVESGDGRGNVSNEVL